MRAHLGPALRLALLMTVVLGLVYPAVMTGIGELFFPARANGSLVVRHGTVVGSRLIGQSFTAARFFQGRPSATTPPYNAAASTPSNYGPTNPALLKEVQTNLAAVQQANPGVSSRSVPPDLVESSGSGLDPDISPAAALLQVPRVARVNHLPVAAIRKLVESRIRGRFLGIYGDPYVNVLELNLAIARMATRSATAGASG